MTKRFLLPLFMALLGALWLGGCGSGGDDEFTGGAQVGPATFGLPFIPAVGGSTLTVGFQNVTTDAAPVFVTAYDSLGGVYGAANQQFTVPARGELRVPLSQITGGATTGGWVCVETRDVNNLDAVTGEPTALATSGYVFAYAHRDRVAGNSETDASPGLTGRSSDVTVTITPDTDRVQVLNYTFDQNAAGAMPQALTYAISTYDTSGAQVGTTVNQAIAANGAFDFAPAVSAGQVRIEPVGAPFPATRQVRYAAACRENGFQTHVESRYLDTSDDQMPALLDLAFEVAFGSDLAGNVHDFALAMSNPTSSSESITLFAVYRKNGVPVLSTPRGYVLGAGRSVYMRTTTLDSVGLLAGEDSWFDDLFGDVLLSTGFDEVSLYVQASRDVNISARLYDPTFNGFFQVLRAIPRTNRASVFDLPIQELTSSDLRNYVSITNTRTTPLTVPIRAYTPDLGTEYIVDSITVPALSRYDWSPDGMIFREEPTDVLGAPVSFLRLDFTPSTGALFRGRSELRDAGDLLLYVAPTLTRD